LDPSLQRAFGGTFGFGLYEECLMYLAQDVAGWTLHEADRLRKLTKEKGKNPKKAAKWRQDFIDDAKKNKNIDPKVSTQIWDEVVDKFQGYGFNLSHSILYSMTSYYTAYLKAHYPLEFLLANLKSEIRSKSKPAKNNIEKIKTEIRRQRIVIMPPDINHSDISYTIKDAKTIVTGLNAMAFVGKDAIQEIVDKRPFRNFFDFMVRCEKKKLNSKSIKVLAATGCLDSFGLKRRQIYLYCEDYRKKLDSWLKKNNPAVSEMNYPWPDEPEWSLSERYALEKLWAGEGFSCGKKDAFVPFFDDKGSIRVKTLKSMNDKERIPSMKAEIKSIFVFKVKKEGSKYLGRDMAKLTIEDVYGDQMSLTMFPEGLDLVNERIKLFSGGKQKLEEGICIHFNGTINIYEDDTGAVLENIFSYAPPPALPADFKEKKKVNLRQPKGPKEEKELDKTATQEEITNDIESELFDAGLIEFDEDPQDN
jgi:DNA polymerase-3 subunit alpha